jgi:O-antigen/teichoic acid export membrane protein
MGVGVILLMPFLVTAYSGPVQGAVFSLSMSIAQTLEFVGSAMGTSLVVHASKNPKDGSKMALVLFVRVSVLVAVGGVLVSLGAPIIFGILDPEYLDLNAEFVVIILAIGSLMRTMFVVWSALQRARREIGPLVVINGLFAGLLMVVLPFACFFWGAVGAAVAVGVAQTAASIAAVFGIARRRDAIRRRVFQYEV